MQHWQYCMCVYVSEAEGGVIEVLPGNSSAAPSRDPPRMTEQPSAWNPRLTRPRQTWSCSISASSRPPTTCSTDGPGFNLLINAMYRMDLLFLIKKKSKLKKSTMTKKDHQLQTWMTTVYESHGSSWGDFLTLDRIHIWRKPQKLTSEKIVAYGSGSQLVFHQVTVHRLTNLTHI